MPPAAIIRPVVRDTSHRGIDRIANPDVRIVPVPTAAGRQTIRHVRVPDAQIECLSESDHHENVHDCRNAAVVCGV
jgi:hypothetical protein